MTVFFHINDALVNFDDPTVLVKKDYSAYLGQKERSSFILSELCSLDMVYAVAAMKGGYYGERMVLKGGLSVRNHVPLLDHRFSFDADYDPNSQSKYTFGDIDEIRKDVLEYGSKRGCRTGVKETKDDSMLYFLEFGYKDLVVREGASLVESPKLEICKTCRVLQRPQKAPMNTFIDLDILGVKPPDIYHVGVEEQLATKLFIIGASGRQRNQFDAYDSMRIVESNAKKIDWRMVKKIFEERVSRHRRGKFGPYVEECRRHLDTMLTNSNKRSNLERTVFRTDFSFDRMIEVVRGMYSFKG